MPPVSTLNLQEDIDTIFSNCISSKLLNELKHADLTTYSDCFNTILLQFICYKIKQEQIKYIMYEGSVLPEPVTIFINENDDKELIENFIFVVGPTQISLVLFNNSQANTTCDTSLSSKNNSELSYQLSVLLLRLYIIAEHTSYHYFSYINSNTLDINHEHYSSSNLMIHDLITKIPDEKIQKYLDYFSEKKNYKLNYAV